jgi:hypothetical protein
MHDALSVFGNENIRENHVAYFEKILIEQNEHVLEDISVAPNYYAWICLSVEHVFWIIRGFCFKQAEVNSENLMLSYNDLVIRFFEVCDDNKLISESERENLYISIVSILDIRHAIVHKGFPNLLKTANIDKFKKLKPKSKKSSPKMYFTEPETKAILRKYTLPRNFSEIKNEIDTIKNIVNKANMKPITF